LGKKIAISFEGNKVKIVHASLKGNNIYIDKTEIISEAEFDYYLRKEKSKEFIVIYNFSESYHGVLTIPFIKTKYIEKIAESEIRSATEIKDFSFIYSPLGERIVENKKVLDIFYFAVRTEDIHNLVERFYNNGKIVKAIYPTVFPVASLFKLQNEAIMGVSGTGRERILFLTKNGAIYFIRDFQSLETKLSDSDIQNINMTINYCFQNLRINPSLVLLTGTLSESYDISSIPSAPLACLYKGEHIHCGREIFNEFIIPIASFGTPKSSNILSKEFKNIYMLKNALVTASMVFFLLTLLCFGFIFSEVRDTADMKGRLKLKRQNNSDVEKIFLEYTAKEAEIKKHGQLVDFLNIFRPGIQKLLVELAELDTKDLIFNSIEATIKDDDSFLITVRGISSADSYTSIQTSFKDLTSALDKIEGVEITSKTMDLQNKIFRIEMDYTESSSAQVKNEVF
jgi:hypothetical protein